MWRLTQSMTYTIDDDLDVTGPTILSITPANGAVAALTSVVVTFSEDVDAATLTNASLVPTNGGTCAAAVTAVNVVNDVATFTVTGVASDCTDGDAFSFEIDPTTVDDLIGNAGTGSAATASYTYDNGPIAFSSITPATSTVAAAPPSITITMTEAIGTFDPSSVTFAGTCAGDVDTGATTVIANGSDVEITLVMTTPCADTETLTVMFDDSLVEDSIGNAGVVGDTAVATYTISIADVTGPTYVSINPATSTVASAPANITITMNETLGAVNAGAVTFGGTCAGDVDTGATTAVANGADIDVTLVMTTPCADGETLTVIVDNTQIEDAIGNAGTGSATRATYTISIPDVTGPSFVSINRSTRKYTEAPTQFSVVMNENLGAANAGAIAFTGTCAAKVDWGTTTVQAVTNLVVVDLFLTTPCINNETLTVEVDYAEIEDLVGNPGSGTATLSTFTIDTVAPTYVGIDVASGTLPAEPSSVNLTFSEAIGDVYSGAVTFGGSCAANVDPSSLTNIMMSGATFEVIITMTTPCADNDTLEIILDESLVEDEAGNAIGSGTSTISTYIIDF